jgi:hypothetical protein
MILWIQKPEKRGIRADRKEIRTYPIGPLFLKAALTHLLGLGASLLEGRELHCENIEIVRKSLGECQIVGSVLATYSAIGEVCSFVAENSEFLSLFQEPSTNPCH